MNLRPDVEQQRKYYARTAGQYDDMHVRENDEHQFALSLMLGLVDFLDVTSILDIGSGTGRALSAIKELRPDIRVVGIEPVAELRDIAYGRGISTEELRDGDAQALDYKDEEFDLICEFGALHHMPNPNLAVAEMLRVSKKAVFISDNNNFGHGSQLGRLIKQALNAVGLWRLAAWLKTGGKGYFYSEGDGVAYSYSVFNNYSQIRKSCSRVHVMNTNGNGVNPYRMASHVALLGVK